MLSPSELRERRLAALSRRGESKESGGDEAAAKEEKEGSSEFESKQAKEGDRDSSAAPLEGKIRLESRVVEDVFDVIFPVTSTPDDRRRWLTQGFKLCDDPVFGLKQGEGGPCGVLAAVQAEMIRTLIFGSEEEEEEQRKAEEKEEASRKEAASSDSGGGGGDGGGAIGVVPKQKEQRQLPVITKEEAEAALIESLIRILGLADTKRLAIVTASSQSGGGAGDQDEYWVQWVPNPTQNFSSSSSSGGSGDGKQAPREVYSSSAAFHSMKDEFSQFTGEKGIILFVLSLVLSRGVEQVKADRDGPDCYLTGQFGHCSQELLNLLLCGRAASNVFDGEIPMGDSGLTLKGVPYRPRVGYLTHLEALRYCQVGSYYKSPHDPIWVIGSASHFTVLFGLSREAVTETASEQLLQRVQRAFKAADTTESGMIQVGKLRSVLLELMPEMAADEHEGRIGALASMLEMPGGTGIILWNEFWKAVSRLMTGATLEGVLADGSSTPRMSDVSTNGLDDIIAATFGGGDGQTGGGGSGRPRSDSDVARDLQAQFDGGGVADVEMVGVVPAGGGGGGGGDSSSSGTSTRPRSDSDLAREMQAQFDAGGEWSGAMDVVDVTGGGSSSSSGGGGGGGGGGASSSSASGSGTPGMDWASDSYSGGSLRQHQHHQMRDGVMIHRHDSIAGEDEPFFELYHYNGLVLTNKPKPTLVKFRLTKRSADSAVGMSVSLDRGDSGGAAAYACPIEAVLKTKWPGSRIDWLGATPPSID